MALIKAGTYRFNGLLDSCGYSVYFEESIQFYNTIPFLVDEGYSALIKAETGFDLATGTYYLKRRCGGFRLSFTAGERYKNWVDYTQVYPVSATPFVPDELLALLPQGIDDIMYDSYAYPYDYYTDVNVWDEEGGNIVTIPEDTEVSDEFGAWFTANAVEQKQISGVWKFNEQITFPEDSIEQSVNFSVKLTYEGTKCVCFLDTMYVDSWDERLTGTSYGFDQEVEIEAGTGIGYHNGSWDWETWGDVVNIFDFGTEPQVVSDAFYDFVTANAIQAAASVQYNGERIANLFGGQTATLKCAGMTMESDVVVEVAEQTESAVGIVGVRIEEV